MITSIDHTNIEELKEVIEDLEREENFNFSLYLPNLKPLYDIFKMFKCQRITIVVETDYIDRHHRDSYYYYFSQKYANVERNCVRLSFFEKLDNPNKIDDWDVFKACSKEYLEERFIGSVVLRPLVVGNIGRTLLDPSKLKISGYIRTCKFDITIYGKRLKINAFPFCSQDSAVSACAETALFNLLQYYGTSYPQNRVYMPSEISQLVENESAYERVLPSDGLSDDAMGRVLLKAHLAPKLYGYEEHAEHEDFEDILHAYVESGIPFILNIPHHSVVVIGHGEIDHSESRIAASTIHKHIEKNDEQLYYYLNTSKLIDEYIIMNDNKLPYGMSGLDDLTFEYLSKNERKCEEPYCEEQRCGELQLNEEPCENREGMLEKAKKEFNSMIVPVYHRIFVDAAGAMKIFRKLFLEDSLFISHLGDTYNDVTWGKSEQNPLVWRMYLTTSRSFKAFKMKKIFEEPQGEYYLQKSLPHFIWVMEIGTVDTYRNNRACVEILLDATSSEDAKTSGILSVTYKEHCIFIPEDCNELPMDIEERLPKNLGDKEKEEWPDFRLLHITKVQMMLYYSEAKFISDSYSMYADSNLKGVGLSEKKR